MYIRLDMFIIFNNNYINCKIFYNNIYCFYIFNIKKEIYKVKSKLNYIWKLKCALKLNLKYKFFILIIINNNTLCIQTHLYFAVVSSASHRGLHCPQQRAVQRLAHFRSYVAAVVEIENGDVRKVAAVVPVLVVRVMMLMCLFQPESMGYREQLLYFHQVNSHL